VTLIEIEAIEALGRDYDTDLAPGLSRRNIVTRGVALNHLVEREFKVGPVTLRGTRLCEPCSHLEKLTRQGVMRGLVHRGGLRAEIVIGGMIRIGDGIVALANQNS
jgi:MOSC domain-containing protein YiiM